MTCRTCKNEKAFHVVSWYDRESDEMVDMCDNCGLEGTGTTVPDAYLPRMGMTFGAICDKLGKPIPVMSKKHKKELMDERGIRECPERLSGNTTWVDGTRGYRRKQFEKERPMLQKLHKEYRERARDKR